MINYSIQNFPINFYDVTKSHTMLGSKLAVTRGKTFQKEIYREVVDCVAVPGIF